MDTKFFRYYWIAVDPLTLTITHLIEETVDKNDFDLLCELRMIGMMIPISRVYAEVGILKVGNKVFAKS